MARGRAANGSGMQPKLRSDGRWESRYKVGTTSDGKPKYKSIYGKTAAEVAEKLRAATASIDTGAYVDPSNMTVKQWLEIWLNEYNTGKSPNTIRVYSTCINKHLIPAFGNVKLCKLQPHAIQQYFNSLAADKQLSSSTIHSIYQVLHRALMDAVRVKYIGYNPSADVQLVRLEYKPMSALTTDELSRLLDAAKGTRYYELIFFAAFTGLRIGEVLGLRWDCVDMETGTITVNAQMDERLKALIPPKENKTRSFVVSPSVIECLRRVHRWQSERRIMAGPLWINEMNLVFTTPNGLRISEQRLRRAYYKALETAGLPEHHFHDLRHTYATLQIQAGTDAKTVSQNLGHSTVSFTLDVYADSTRDLQQAAANKLETLILDIV